MSDFKQILHQQCNIQLQTDHQISVKSVKQRGHPRRVFTTGNV